MIAAILGALLLWAALSTGAAALWSAARTLMKRAARNACPDHPPVDQPTVPLSATERATFARLIGLLP